MGKIRIGISGWRYTPWRGEFYPDELPEALELWYASRILPAIEINGSFYSLQRPAYYERWYADTPRGFVFAVKGGRYITHMKRLRDIEAPLANFFASGLLLLREKFGPLLWQFPPNLRYDAERFEEFFELLPRDTRAAAELGLHHDPRLRGRTHLEIDRNRRLRHAVEIRHPSFLREEFIAQLRNHNIALVVAESAGKWPLAHDVTADFVYCRLHGDKKLYRSGYSMPALRRWAAKITAWNRGSESAEAEKISRKKARPRSSRDVFCFFDNTDDKLRAPEDAQKLMRLLGTVPISSRKWGLSPFPISYRPELSRAPDGSQMHRSQEFPMARRYGKKASRKVKKAMHERKRGTLRSGSGKKVTSRKQAIAIALSQARKSGAKVPKKRSTKKRASKKRKTARKKR